MGLGDFFRAETLDTRFQVPSGSAVSLPSATPSRWRSTEFYIYYLAFLTVPVLMLRAIWQISQPSHPTYPHYQPLLEPGWIPGRLIDNSDVQYGGFRGNLPYLAIIVVLHPLLRRAYEAWNGKREGGGVKTTADARMEARLRFDVAFAAVYLLGLHGISAFKILLILYLNFEVATALPVSVVPVATWTFNVGILFTNELCRGYSAADLAALLLPSTITVDSTPPASHVWGAWLDSFGGLLPRWEILFNITVLKMIAFNFDRLWSLDRRAASPVEKKNLDPTALSEADRVKSGARRADFSFRNYLAYTLYSPLYLIGPVINFNDYISQVRHPLPSTSFSRILSYALRFFLCLLTMEVVLHHFYAVAISKSLPDWNQYTPLQLSMIGYFNLHIIWLKLLIPWRFMRLWSLVDGIDPPENMIRCMSNNYSALAFWRGWHRSFNQWVLRYLFIPLGGSRVSTPRAVFNFLTVFTFVALWHDINLRLLMWGWLITLFVLPELVASFFFPARDYLDRPDFYRWLCGVGAVGNMLMMMAANLVGFAIGVDGLKGLIVGIVHDAGGQLFLAGACAGLFIGAQIMFEMREAEKRRGLNMKC